MGFEYAKLYWRLLVLGSTRCLLWGLMEDTKKIIPGELRIGNSCFTSIALVGNIKKRSSHNHPHKDINYVVSMIINL